MPFVDTRDLAVKEPLPGWQGRFFHSERMTFAYDEVERSRAIVVDHPRRDSVGGVTTD